ncbi:MAG: hypothetical protein J0I06_06485 [Planctomycetes bacterium]|nr:hypothetical protein [Planctomycetota bacterium]
MFRRLVVILPATLFCAALGCSGDNRSEVSGTVKVNGQPVAEGAINFIPTAGNTGAGAGAVITNGKYHIPRSAGAAAGKNRVELRAFKNTGRKVQDPTGAPGALADERVMIFPPEYNDRSTLVRDVKSGSDTIDFDITVPAR